MLSFNERDRTFFVTGLDEPRAKAAGLARSRTVHTSSGERVWYTAGYDGRPDFNPYAVLEFWDHADPAAKEVLAPLRARYDESRTRETTLTPPVPNGMVPMGFQCAGVEYALRYGSVLIGDDPGVGKTAQAVMLANARDAKRVLVVCPAAIRLGWAREVRAWSTIPRVTTYPILAKRDGVNPACNYVIVSYELMRDPSVHAALCALRWDLLVLDEAHYLKTADAVRTRAVFGGGTGSFAKDWLTRHAEQTIGLTGTPLPNRPRECYTLARGLCWESVDFMSEEAFRYRFNPSGVMLSREGNPYVREERGRLPELQARLRCNFMVRREKRDVLTDLPDERYELTYVEPTGAIQSVLAKERLLDFSVDDLIDPSFEIQGMISTIRREMGEAMAPRVVEYARYLLDVVGVSKVLLVAHHTSVLTMLGEGLARYGIAWRRGGMSTPLKQQHLDAFVADPDIRVFLAQLETVEGADGLQKVCSDLVMAEVAWSHKTNEQVVGRLVRKGQHSNVIARIMLVAGDWSERILGTVLDKTKVVHASLDRRL